VNDNKNEVASSELKGSLQESRININIPEENISEYELLRMTHINSETTKKSLQYRIEEKEKKQMSKEGVQNQEKNIGCEKPDCGIY